MRISLWGQFFWFCLLSDLKSQIEANPEDSQEFNIISPALMKAFFFFTLLRIASIIEIGRRD